MFNATRRKEKLSRVYLDDYPITLMGDEAQPPLSRIVRAGGKRPDSVDVVYLTRPGDRTGTALPSEQIIDRTAEPTRPIYLRTVPKHVKPILTAMKDVKPEVIRPSRDRDAPFPSDTQGPRSDVDPVISQLGRDPQRRTLAKGFVGRQPHERAVFRGPNGTPAQPSFDLPPAPPVEPKYGPNVPLAADSAVMALRARQAAAHEALAKAEAEAEQRQEDERNQEDTLKDEEESDREADEDKGE